MMNALTLFVSKFFALLALVLVASGCQSLGEISQKIDAADQARRKLAYQNVEDPTLVQQIYKLGDDGKVYLVRNSIADEGFHLSMVEPWGVSLRRKVSDGPNQGTVELFFRKNRGDIQSLAAVDLFVSNAKKRGSTVKMYRPALGLQVARSFKVGFYLDPAPNTRQWYDTDEVLVEYAPDGRVLAFVTRNYQSIISIGAALYEHVNLYYGPQSGKQFQNQVSRRFLLDNEIRDL